MQLMVQLENRFADRQGLPRDLDARESGLLVSQRMPRAQAGYARAD
jgi:hypothetical protein